MKNILVVGNSHVGALRKGFNCIEVPPQFKFHYIALAGRAFCSFKVINNCLTYPEKQAANIQALFKLNSFPCLDDFEKIIYVEGPCRLSLHLYSTDRRIPHLSKAVIREIVHNINSPLFLSLLNAVGPSRLIYLGAPLISSAANEGVHLNQVPLMDGNSTSGHCLADCIRKFCLSTYEDDALPTILLPPSHLLDKNQFNTLECYIRGGIRVNGNSRSERSVDFEQDMGHGNLKYGKGIAEHLLNYLIAN